MTPEDLEAWGQLLPLMKKMQECQNHNHYIAFPKEGLRIICDKSGAGLKEDTEKCPH